MVIQQPQTPETDDFEIIDETPQEQLTAEEAVLAGEDVPEQPETAGPEPDVEPEETAEPEAEAVTETEVSSEPPPPSEPEPEPVEEAPQRLEDSPQWRQAQSAWQQQINEANRLAEERQRRLDAVDLEAEVEARIRREEAALAAQYGEEEARRIARRPDNIQNARDAEANKRRVQQIEVDRQTEAAQWEQTARFMTARLFRYELGLTASQEAELAQIGDATAMQIAAQHMQAGARQAPAKPTPSVPAETPETTLETGTPSTSGPETPNQMFARVNAKPSWEWTDAEVEFMRTGRVS